ncbi:MAG TPA: hypothetical protein VFV67_09835 [Actinophytocola sp.]|uniref:hypothetical protein n=1 Tax=Actinophytocola sp. TaxID=1872138 RepID=UPI002DBA02AD|nr:hypothetical protein [Actinophytocola sp.]HEU5470940.1 hypothetical protein [Actinophytocola sp.]
MAFGTFGLMLVLARRLRAVTERVNLFLPASDGGLPHPGTPVPEFSAVSVDGTAVSHTELAVPERIFAMLTTDCASCHDQVPGLRDLEAPVRPLVVVIGPPEKRAGMVAALAERALLVEEPDHGPITTAFDIQEFPAVLLVRDGVVQHAGHGLAGVLESARTPARAHG